MSKKLDKLEQLFVCFKYWNNRGKSAICRYILEKLDIGESEFLEHCHGWKEQKLILNEEGCFDLTIDP